MQEVYFPIENSNLKSIIPPDEEILYSTLSHITRVHKTSKSTWRAHVLLTPRGVAFTEPNMPRFGLNRKYNPSLKASDILMHYLPWYQIEKVRFGKIIKRAETYLGKDDSKYTKTKVQTRYKLIRGLFFIFAQSNFELKEDFKLRIHQFPIKFIPICIQSKKNLLETMTTYPENYSRSDKKRCVREINNLEADLIKAKQKLAKKGISV